jgi:DNA-binding winged helix-turn-helix (wHTH) protein
MASERVMDVPNGIRFGGFVLNRARGCLEDETGSERFLRPKSYRVLEILCERRGELISKDELVRVVWPDVFVSDDSLAHCVSDIRRALGPDGARLLRTVPRRGYMLVASKSGPEAPARIEKLRMIWAGGLAAGLLLAAGGVWWTTPRPATEAATEAAAAVVQQAEALLEGRDWRRREDNERARRLLEQVVADDPGNTDALASLGLTYWMEVQHLAWGAAGARWNSRSNWRSVRWRAVRATGCSQRCGCSRRSVSSVRLSTRWQARVRRQPSIPTILTTWPCWLRRSRAVGRRLHLRR